MKQVWSVLTGDIKFIFCYIGGGLAHLIVFLYGSFLMLWLTGFVHEGVLKDRKEAEAVYA